MDISAQIKKLSEHPIAGGGYCDLYLGERLGKEKVALKLVRLFGSTDADKETARRVSLSAILFIYCGVVDELCWNFSDL